LFIALVSNPGIIHQNVLTQALYVRLHFASDTEFLIAFAATLMVFIVISNVVVAVATWLIVTFSLRLGVEIQQDIFHGYLHRDYVELSRTNSGNLVAVLTAHTGRFIYMVMQPLLTLISQGFIVLLIVLGLIWYNVQVALFAGLIIGGGYLIVFSNVRRRLVEHGELAWGAAMEKQRMLNESLGGIKEIRLIGTEDRYEERLDEITRRGLHSDTVIGLMGDIPKFVLESIAFCALLGLGIYLLKGAQKPQDIVGILSLYAMAGYKLLPAAQNVFKSASSLRANAPLVSELRPDILAGRAAKSVYQSPVAPGSLPAGDIRLSDVSFTYPETDHPTIKGVTVDIARRSISVIVGPSGAGKSTLADLLLGLLRPSHGTIRVGDLQVADHTAAWQRNLGYVPQDIFILDDTIASNISFGTATASDMDKVKRAARLANIDRFVDATPGGYEFVVGENGSLLSGGQRQRIGIARALYHDADVIVLDEATSALDTITEREIISTLTELRASKTIIMIAHRLATLKCADQIIFLTDGRLVDVGTYDELMTRSADFRALVAASTQEH
jgi:ABC-type multidrug transport system fused ATPase/permease subunit